MPDRICPRSGISFASARVWPPKKNSRYPGRPCTGVRTAPQTRKARLRAAKANPWPPKKNSRYPGRPPGYREPTPGQ
jgi:hypothetical protein